ncbi:MAG TPA: glycosyltransferase family 25 protein [Candidatus Acidoferrales bacterium]|jgi:glycosyl transferase family 25|nr:glycosyltransferase family 25 protein [Candidatus Acidoferrales bacterium]
MNPFKNGMIGGVYVVHARRFTDRAVQMKAQLGKLDIPFEFIEPYDADVLDAGALELFSDSKRAMTRGQKSCTLKHLEALRKIVAGGYKYGLVFEDDAILDPQFLPELEKVVAEAQSINHPHAIYLGIGSNMFVPWRKLRRGRRLYEAEVSRCAEAYLIGAEAARIRLDWVEKHKMDRPVDHVFTQIDRETGIRMYWSNPATVVQGSMNGFYFSTQEGGTRLARLWQFKLRFELQRLRRKYIYRFFQ